MEVHRDELVVTAGDMVYGLLQYGISSTACLSARGSKICGPRGVRVAMFLGSIVRRDATPVGVRHQFSLEFARFNRVHVGVVGEACERCLARSSSSSW